LGKNAQAIIDIRLAHIRGNFGDCKRLSGTDGLSELKINFGPWFRVYYGTKGDKLIIFLSEGYKQSQDRDARRAKEYRQNYLIRLEEED